MQKITSINRATGLAIGYIVAIYVRYWLMKSDYQNVIASHIEVSTPVNSWRRVVEGLTLIKNGVNPYVGDLLHESPLFLSAYEVLHNILDANISLLFIAADILTAHILFTTVRLCMFKLFVDQERNKEDYPKDIKKFLLGGSDFVVPPYYVAIVYLYNPFTVFNCVGQTTTVFCNLFLALFLYGLVTDVIIISAFALAVAAVHSFYPIVLIVPLFLKFYVVEHKTGKAVLAVLTTLSIIVIFIVTSRLRIGSWEFLEDTIGFILSVPDLKPNIGLFWYFFIEMFDHFQTLFIYSFQINATILYLIPLSIRFRQNPMLLTMSLLSLMSIFKSYPCIGDIGFVLSLFPYWTHLFNYMQQGFLVGVNLLVSSVLGPTLWHLWIYSRSANANFYFGVTLAFAVAQIFLITDILFAYIKREFSINTGRLRKVNGEAATLALE